MIGAKVYNRRRQDLMQLMGEEGVAVVSTSLERTRNRDVIYRLLEEYVDALEHVNSMLPE